MDFAELQFARLRRAGGQILAEYARDCGEVRDELVLGCLFGRACLDCISVAQQTLRVLIFSVLALRLKVRAFQDYICPEVANEG